MWNCFRRTRILKVSPYLDPQEGCQPTGNRCCTSKGSHGSACTEREIRKELPAIELQA